MKQIKNLTVLISASAIFAISCKKSSDSASIVGTWKINTEEIKISVSGAVVPGFPKDSIISFSGTSTAVFNSNNSYTVNASATDSTKNKLTSGQGNYLVSGSRLIAFGSNFPAPDTLTINSITSANLTLYGKSVKNGQYNGINALVTSEIFINFSR
jgi:hypothetical protein